MRNTRIELDLGGTSRPLLFDHSFFENVTKEMSLTELEELQTIKPWRFVPTLATAALQSGVEFEGKKDKIDYNTVAKWLGEVEDPMKLNQIAEAYKTALGFTYHANFGRDLIAEQEEKLKVARAEAQKENQ